MKTLVIASIVALALTGLAAATAPSATASTFCATDIGPCVCVVNFPPGQGCGSSGTGCFVGVRLSPESEELGIACV
jgi:hypothetical protein